MDELITRVTGGVPVNAVANGADLDRVLQHENHSSVIFAGNLGKKTGKTSGAKNA